MTTRTCSAALIRALFTLALFIPALSFSLIGAPDASSMLAVLARNYRESPTPAHRAAIATHVASHPEDAALADLALGISAYEQKNWSDAIALLKPLPARLPKLADYAVYYLDAARVENEDF